MIFVLLFLLIFVYYYLYKIVWRGLAFYGTPTEVTMPPLSAENVPLAVH